MTSTLFDKFDGVSATKVETEQDRQIKRVGGNIGEHVIAFARQKGVAEQWHMQDLADFVSEKVNKRVAPDSASRILRLLRSEGLLKYRVVNRRQSLYQLAHVQ